MENAVYEEFTEILMCSLCKSDLEVNEKGNLLCKECNEEYRIINGIPVMLLSSAKVTNDEFIQFYNRLYSKNNGKQSYN